MESAEDNAVPWEALPRGRLNYYLQLSQQDEKKALQLHEWNTQLSESLYVPLQAFEITLRNILDIPISEHHEKQFGTKAWYESQPGRADYLKQWCHTLGKHGCTEQEWSQIEKAKRNLRDRRRQLTHNNFIASTSFGLWVRFLSKHYDEMWKHVLALAPVFQGQSLRREELWRVADQAKRARNATAHYEPVIEKGKPDDFGLDEFHGQLVHYLQLFSPRTSAWVLRNSRFSAVWQRRPSWWS